MENNTAYVSASAFRSKLIPASAILFSLAALCGLGSVCCFFDKTSFDALVQDIILGGITDASSVRTWKAIHIVLTAAAFVWPALMAVSMALASGRQPDRGWNVLDTAAMIIYYALVVCGCGLIALAVYRFAAYIIFAASQPQWLYLLYSMVISEALMITLTVLLFVTLLRFLARLRDGALSISYTLLTGKLDALTMPPFAAGGFLVLAIFSIAAAVDRLFTLTIIRDYVQDYYKLLVADHPLLQLSALALIFAAAGDMLVYFYLRKYKRRQEQLLYEARRKIMYSAETE